MNLTRRHALALSGAAVTVSLIPVKFAYAASDATMAAIEAFTGGAAVADSGIDIIAPEIAENGNTVPISVSAEGASSIMVLADGNPSPGVVTFHFGELSASSSASTRIRLAGTQSVIAIAKMADGTFAQASREVKVTIGGCGG